MPLSHLPSPKAILFDWDNTLIDSERSIYNVLNTILQAFQRPLFTYEEFAKLPPVSIRSFLNSVLPVDCQHKAEELYNHHARNLTLTPFSHVPLLLEWVQAKTIPMGVVSNKDGTLLRRDVENLGWGHFFQAIVGANDTPEEKPSAVPLWHALELMQIPAGTDVWFVGDSMIDIACAVHAGCQPIGVGAHTHLHPHESPKFPCHRTLLSALEKELGARLRL